MKTLCVVCFILGISSLALATDSTLFAPSSSSFGSGSMTLLHPSPGVDYYYDNRGNSTTVYRGTPGMSWYSTQGTGGHIAAQGFLFESVRPSSLEFPSSQPLPKDWYLPPAYTSDR